MGLNTVYKARSFDLSDLTGISNETLAMHFKLYEGYVTNTNTLNEKIAELIKDGQLDATKTAAFSELRRRYGFEYNGMVLHETGNVAGYKPILIMDVWEHAFIKDYAPADRPKYIEAFFSNIDWDTVNSRLSTAGSANA